LPPGTISDRRMELSFFDGFSQQARGFPEGICHCQTLHLPIKARPTPQAVRKSPSLEKLNEATVVEAHFNLLIGSPLSTLHRPTLLPMPPAATWPTSGEKPTHVTRSSQWASNNSNSLRVFRSHKRVEPSAEPLTAYRPLGANASAVTSRSCPSSQHMVLRR